MHKITSSVKTGGFLILFLVFAFSLIVASTDSVAGLSVSVNQSTDVSCYNADNGAIDITVAGGDGNYSFTWTGPNSYSSTSEDISGLPAGTYTVNVSDGSGNTGSKTIEIIQPDELVISNSTTTPVSCNGDSDGVITAGSVTGGNDGFQYSINGTSWQSSTTFNNLTAGSYTIYVKDSKGCQTSENITITQPDPLQISGSTTTAVACNGGAEGTVTVGNVSGGNSGYTYSIDGGAFGNNTTFTGLLAGDHTITVKDSKGCEASETVTVDEPPVLTISGSTTTAVSCNGESDGTATAGNVAGGNGGYTYSIDSGSYSSNNTFSGLVAGDHIISVRDSKGCEVSETVTVDQPDILSISGSTTTDVSCNGESDGSATAGNVSGGNGGYTYSIDNGGFGNNTTFNNLSAGDHTITVKDSKGCEATETVTVTEPSVLEISGSTTTPVSCNGESDGTITAATATGGNGGYQYSIDGTTWQSSTTFNNLTAGSYTVYVKDSKDCQASENITITQPDLLQISGSTTTPVSCNGGAEGTSTAGTVTGGNGGYTYSIDGKSFGNSTTFTGLTAGTYTITVKDSNGCEATENVTVTEPPVLEISGSTTTPVSCNGGNDGTATAGNVTGGNGGYAYSIDGTTYATSTTFSGLAAGDHIIYVRDEKGCETSETVTVTEPEPLTATDPSFTPVSCNGETDGTITAGTPSGGNGNYRYAIDSGNFSTSTTFSGLAAGDHILKIKDEKGCQIEQTIQVTEPDPLSMTEPSSTDATCFGGNDGTITVGTVSGGNGNYEYSLDNTNFTTSTTFSGLEAGNYTIFVKDDKACSLQQLISVGEPDQLQATIATTDVKCYEGYDGAITLSQPTGGHGNYEYSIDDTNWQSSSSFTGLTSGTYTVYIRDADHTGCEVILNDNVQINQPASAVSATATTTRTTIYGTATGSATANATGGTPGYTYEWRNAGETTVLQTTKTATNLKAGDYELTVKDKNGCSFVTTVTINDIIYANIIPTSICSDDETELIRTSYFEVEDLTAQGGVGPYTYSWSFGANSTPSTATGPGSHEVKYSTTGNKDIVLSVTDSEGVTTNFYYTQFVGECYRDNCGSDDFLATSYFVGDYNGNKTTVNNCQDGVQKYIYMNLASNSERYSLYAELTYTITNTLTGESNTYTKNGCFYENAAVPNSARTIPIDWDCGSIITVDNIYLTFSNNIKWGCGQGPNPKCFSTNNQETVQSPLYATAVPNELKCYGSEFGTITVTASGGRAPYQYSIKNATTGFQDDNVFRVLKAGDYNVWVRDIDGNIYQVPTVTITQPDNPITLETSAANPTCYGGLGSATVTASGGTPYTTGEPYTYLWNDASEQTTSTATGLEAGDYTITVIDANGCQTIGTVTITQPEELTIAEAGEDQIYGCGFNTTNLEANTPTTGVGEWSIISGTGGTIADSSDPNSAFTGTDGTYTLRWTISHADGTCATYDDVNVTFVSDCSKLDFDGIDDHVIFGDNYPLSSGSFTIEVWVKPESVSGVKTVLSKRDYSNLGSGGYDLIINNGAPTFRWGNNSVSTSSKISTDRWYHLAVIYQNSKVELYVDGIRVGNSSASNPIVITAPAILGAMYDSATPDGPKNYFDGWIEELRIWNAALTTEQLHFMMNQRVVDNGGKTKGEVLPMNVPNNLNWTNLIGYYRLMANDISNGETPDISSTPVNGILKNIETLQENTAPLPYISNQNGSWRDKNTWLRPTVWDVPNGKGINGDYINWNIAEISHDIYSTTQDIYMLGLISHTGELKIDGNVNSQTGQGLTITHYLKLDGTINLEGESQLVQTEGSVLDEASSGYLDRDQQGTENSFNYNYWSSPVSLQGQSNNNGFDIADVLMDGTNPASPGNISFNYQYHYADKPYTGPKRISSYWLFEFKGIADTYAEWHRITPSTHLDPGTGWSMKGTSGSAPVRSLQNYVFRGKPNNADITLAISSGENRLVGNPYPSAIDADQFIRDNLKDVDGGTASANIFNGSLYFWDHFGAQYSHILEEYVGGYGVYNLSGGIPAVSTDERIDATGQKSTKVPARYIPVAQGFFVNTVLDEVAAGNYTISGGNILFRNAQRAFVKESSGDSYFLAPMKSQATGKQAKYAQDTRYKIRLSFSSPKGYHRQILVTADSNTSNDFDLGYDAPLIEDNAEDMYWMISKSEYVIQAVPNFNRDQVLPIGIKVSEEGEFSIQIDETENFEKGIDIYLHDKQDSIYFNLQKSAFKGTAEPGTINDRYEIVFEKPSEKTETNPEMTSTNLIVDYLRNTHEIVLSNPDLLEIQHIELYSLNGQQISEYNEMTTSKTLYLPVDTPLSSAVYVVRVFTPEGEYSKKVIISD